MYFLCTGRHIKNNINNHSQKLHRKKKSFFLQHGEHSKEPHSFTHSELLPCVRFSSFTHADPPVPCHSHTPVAAAAAWSPSLSSCFGRSLRDRFGWTLPRLLQIHHGHSPLPKYHMFLCAARINNFLNDIPVYLSLDDLLAASARRGIERLLGKLRKAACFFLL